VYNRIFLFASLDGHPFQIITYSEQETNKMFSYCWNPNTSAVGNPFVLVHPDVDRRRSSIQSQVPTLSVQVPFLPLDIGFMKYVPKLPAVPPAADCESAVTVFCYHNVNLNIANAVLRGSSDVRPPCCNGYWCDRKLKYQPNGACGCLRTSPLSCKAIVLEYDIDLEETEIASSAALMAKEDDDDNLLLLQRERSLRTTQLFMSLAEISSPLRQLEVYNEHAELKGSVKECCNYINNKGGFTIIGTISRTVQKKDNDDDDDSDDDDDDDDDDDNDQRTNSIHVAYLYPSNVSVPSNPMYKQKMFR
jgi:hypothetical protein